ncbi:hypothetical protein ACSQ5K_26690 [Pseudomonas sp. PhalM4]
MITSSHTDMITPADFEELLRDVHWSHVSSTELVDLRGENDSIQFGAGTVTSTLGDISITWTEGYECVTGVSDSLVATTEGLDEYLVIKGLAVLDDDGETLSQGEIRGMLPAKFRSVDYSAFDEA